jgi:hypothetical protein
MLVVQAILDGVADMAPCKRSDMWAGGMKSGACGGRFPHQRNPEKTHVLYTMACAVSSTRLRSVPCQQLGSILATTTVPYTGQAFIHCWRLSVLQNSDIRLGVLYEAFIHGR